MMNVPKKSGPAPASSQREGAAGAPRAPVSVNPGHRRVSATSTAMWFLPEVLAAFHVSGAADLQLHVAVRDVGHLRDPICDRLATRKEVDRCESSIIYSYTRNPRLPRYIAAPAERRSTRATRRRSPTRHDRS